MTRQNDLDCPPHPLVRRREFRELGEVDETGRGRHRSPGMKQMEMADLWRHYAAGENQTLAADQDGVLYVSRDGIPYVCPLDENGQPAFPLGEGERRY